MEVSKIYREDCITAVVHSAGPCRRHVIKNNPSRELAHTHTYCSVFLRNERSDINTNIIKSMYKTLPADHAMTLDDRHPTT